MGRVPQYPGWPPVLKQDSPFAQGLASWFPLGPYGSFVGARDFSGKSNAVGEMLNMTLSDWTREPNIGMASALDFDDTDDIIALPGTNTPGHPLDLLGDFSCSVIMRPTADSGTIFAKRDGANAQYQFFLGDGDYNLRVGADTSLSTGNRQILNAWSMVSAASDLQDATNSAAAFTWRNLETGIFTAETPVDAHGTASHEDVRCSIGARWNTDPTPAFQYAGKIADIRVYDKRHSDEFFERASHPSNIWDLYWQPRRVSFFLPLVPHTSTGLIIFNKLAIAGTGDMDFKGTGALSLDKLAIAGTGAQGHPGTGSLVYDKLSINGTGDMDFSGSGALIFNPFSMVGAGVHTQSLFFTSALMQAVMQDVTKSVVRPLQV